MRIPSDAVGREIVASINGEEIKGTVDLVDEERILMHEVGDLGTAHYVVRLDDVSWIRWITRDTTQDEQYQRWKHEQEEKQEAERKMFDRMRSLVIGPVTNKKKAEA